MTTCLIRKDTDVDLLLYSSVEFCNTEEEDITRYSWKALDLQGISVRRE